MAFDFEGRRYFHIPTKLTKPNWWNEHKLKESTAIDLVHERSTDGDTRQWNR